MKPGRDRGLAAVELALVVCLLLPLTIIMVWFGLHSYSKGLAQKAAYDAASYLSSASVLSMGAPRGTREVELVTRIVELELAELALPGGFAPAYQLSCDGGACGLLVPSEEVSADVQLVMYDEFDSLGMASLFGYSLTNDNVWRYVHARRAMPYVGN